MILDIITNDGHYDSCLRVVVSSADDIKREINLAYGHLTPCDDMSYVSAEMLDRDGNVLASAGGKNPDKVAQDIIDKMNIK